METKSKKQTAKSGKGNEATVPKRKSKITLWWEKNPNGIGSEIVNMRAILR